MSNFHEIISHNYLIIIYGKNIRRKLKHYCGKLHFRINKLLNYYYLQSTIYGLQPLIEMSEASHGILIFVSSLRYLTVLPGGGLFGPENQIINNNSKTAQSSTFKLGKF